MAESRNQLRQARRRAEAEKPGTIQYAQAHRTGRPRRWMIRALAKINGALGPRRLERVRGRGA